MKEKRLPEATGKKYVGKRPRIDLGRNFDGTHTKLPPYVVIDGIQIHPSRLNRWRKRQQKAG